jgi:uncharacterized integral membrane protein
MKPSPYKGRKPSIVRNFWIYRRLIALACVLGLMLWFVWANDAQVTVSFPFGLGALTSRLGLVILLSALVGSVVTALGMTVYLALRRVQGVPARGAVPDSNPLPDDLPPPDYAAKTEEFPGSPLS